MIGLCRGKIIGEEMRKYEVANNAYKPSNVV